MKNIFLSFYRNIFLSKYCMQKCLVCIGPKYDNLDRFYLNWKISSKVNFFPFFFLFIFLPLQLMKYSSFWKQIFCKSVCRTFHSRRLCCTTGTPSTRCWCTTPPPSGCKRGHPWMMSHNFVSNFKLFHFYLNDDK